MKYIAANNQEMPSEGEKTKFMTKDGEPKAIRFQVCDVNKPLASVGKICVTGHRVAFEAKG